MNILKENLFIMLNYSFVIPTKKKKKLIFNQITFFLFNF